MRTALLAFAATTCLGLLLTACGGGGGTTTAPAAIPAPTTPASSSPVQEINNFTGPSSKMSISFKIPSKAPSQAQRAQLTSVRATKAVSALRRTIANTSPSAALRALGQKKPAFISPQTYVVEFVLTDSSNNVQVDDSTNCYQLECSMTFDAPVGTGFTGTLYLYNTSYYLVGAGTYTPISVTLGNTTTVPLTVNGLVAYIAIQLSNNGPFLDDPGTQPTFTVTPVAEDYNENVITTPGVLIDSNLYQIGTVTLSVDTDTLPSAPQTLTPQADLSFLPVSYTYQGETQESSINFTATANETGASPYVPVLYTWDDPYPTQVGSNSISITPTSLNWTNQGGYPVVQGDPTFNNEGGGGNYTYYDLEFPLGTNSGTYTLGLTDNSTTFGGNITISDNSGCTGGSGVVASYSPALGSTAYTLLSGSPFFQITMGSSGATNTCVIIATDGTNTSQLNIYTDSSSLTIQSKIKTQSQARKH